MNRTTWLLALLALLTAFGVGRLIDRARTREPRALLASAESLLAVEPVDYERVLYELNLGLELLQPGQDEALERSLLEARASAQEKRGILQSAIRDYRRLIEFSPPNEEDLRQRLARLQLYEKQYEGLAQTLAPILERVPWHTGVKLLLGLSAQRRSNQAFDAMLAALRNSLPSRILTSASALASRARAQDPQSPQSGALFTEFKALLSTELGAKAADRVAELEQAAELLASARGLFVESLMGYAHSEAAYGLGQIFLDAGRIGLSVELMLAASEQEQVRTNLASQQVLARALMRLGRPQTASQIVDRTFPGQINETLVNEFLPEWGAILYETRDWSRLKVIGRRLGVIYGLNPHARGQQDAGLYYLGSAEFALGNLKAARVPLQAFARADALEPQPGSLATAYMHLAAIANDQGDSVAEANELTAGLEREPRYSAAAWLRLAELEHERPSEALTAERAEARAIALDPTLEAQRWPELIGWGRQRLSAASFDVPLQRELMLRQARAFPPDSTDVVLLFELAELHFQMQSTNPAHLCLEQIDKLVPDLGPALDLRAKIYGQQGLIVQQVKTLLRRAATPGCPTEVLTQLRELHAKGDLQPEQRLEWLQLDSGHSGALAFARQAIDRGRPDLGLRGLEPGLVGQPPPLGDRGLCLAAEAELALEHPARALERLKLVSADSPLAVTALGLRLKAVQSLGRDDELLPLIDAVMESKNLGGPQAIELVDALLVSGQLEAARHLLAALDRRSPEADGAATTLRMGLAALLDRDGAAAAEAWDRSEAWFEDGTPALGRLLLAIHSAGWTSLPELVRAARTELLDKSEFDLCLLAALEERLDEALALAQAGEKLAPEEPLWSLARLVIQNLRAERLVLPQSFGNTAGLQTLAFLRGQSEARHDPRQALLLLLCVDRPVFTLLARRLLSDSAGDAPLWNSYLLARSDLCRGDTTEARAQVSALTVRFPDFAPGWDLREELLAASLKSIDHPDLLLLRAQRSLALAESASEASPDSVAQPSGPAELLTLALELERQGATTEALEFCRRAVQRYPEDAGAHWFYSRILAQHGALDAALTQATEFVERAEPEAIGWHLSDYLGLLARAHQEQALNDAGLLLQLDGLARRVPQDPLVALALARYDLRSHPDSRSIGVERAFDRLRRFRTSVADSALESLRSGSSALWLEFYLTHDPEQAERFVRGELRLLPENLDLWLMLGRCFEAQTKLPVALEHYRLIRSMVPDTRAIARCAEILAELGTDHMRLEADVGAWMEFDKLPPEAARPRFLRAKSMVYGRQGAQPEGLALLSGLWAERQQNEASVSSAELALVYGSALLRRSELADQPTIEGILKVGLESETDPLRRDLLQALSNLSRWLLQAKPKDLNG